MEPPQLCDGEDNCGDRSDEDAAPCREWDRGLALGTIPRGLRQLTCARAGAVSTGLGSEGARQEVPLGSQSPLAPQDTT